ncbi:MmgE/PrpD family protein [Psychromonas ossibalaenae]|uniref:MmgE/PrpD family protein n=1 Tax=Psychromonas ossibalaenae TaxID=444922 RepID=UPI00036E7C0E|nr:MmgE/PrpD family protein [Psychromonas ossibalaenae]
MLKLITDTVYHDFTKAASGAARKCILDCLGVALAGVNQQPLKKLHRALSLCSTQSGQSPWGCKLQTDYTWSIFLNTQAASYFDLDDGHRLAQGHPGAVIIPLVIEEAVKTNKSYQAVQSAVIVGYQAAVEAAVIIRCNGGPRKGSSGWAVIGAVAALCHLHQLDVATTTNALGFSEYLAPQAPQDRSLAYPSDMKEGMAYAPLLALQCVALAKAGVTAMRPFIVDKQYQGKNQFFHIENTYFKQYACCRFAHPVIDSLASLIALYHFSFRDILRIRVFSFEKDALLSRTNITNSVEAMYSIPYAAAVWLVEKAVNPEHMLEHAFTNKVYLSLAEKISIEIEPEITARFPVECLARTEVLLRCGSVYTSALTTAKGDPSNAYRLDELIDKYKRLVFPVIGQVEGERLADAVLYGDSISAVKLYLS